VGFIAADLQATPEWVRRHAAELGESR